MTTASLAMGSATSKILTATTVQLALGHSSQAFTQMVVAVGLTAISSQMSVTVVTSPTVTVGGEAYMGTVTVGRCQSGSSRKIEIPTQ